VEGLDQEGVGDACEDAECLMVELTLLEAPIRLHLEDLILLHLEVPILPHLEDSRVEVTLLKI